MSREKLMDAIKSTEIPLGYQMRSTEILDMLDAADGDIVRSVIFAFTYGFLKGQRAAKANAKRKEVSR